MASGSVLPCLTTHTRTTSSVDVEIHHPVLMHNTEASAASLVAASSPFYGDFVPHLAVTSAATALSVKKDHWLSKIGLTPEF